MTARGRSGHWRARFAGALDGVVDFYHGSLQWVLRHQFGTLMVTLMTLAATIALYVVMPKGFLPLQDTGLITAVTEAGPSVSFDEMQRRQHLVEDAIRKDPDVQRRGVGDRRQPAQRHAQYRPADHHAQAARRAQGPGRRHHGAAQARGRRHSRHDGLFPGRPGHPDFHPRQPLAVSIHAGQHQPSGSGGMGRQADAGVARNRRRCATSPPKRRRTARASPSMSTARRPAASASPCRA